MLYIRHRHKRSVSHHAKVKGSIGHPILPPPPPPLTMQQVFFPHDSQIFEPEEPLTPVAPLSFGTRTRTRTRAVSSVYGSDRALHARDTIGNFSGIPYRGSSNSSNSSSSRSRSGDMSDVRGPFDPDPGPGPDIGSPPLPLNPLRSRNLTGNRRSSVFSNYKPQLEGRESWGGLDGIREGDEGDEGGDVGEMWEERRRIF